MIKPTKFTDNLLEKPFEKQTKTTENQGENKIKAIGE